MLRRKQCFGFGVEAQIARDETGLFDLGGVGRTDDGKSADCLRCLASLDNALDHGQAAFVVERDVYQATANFPRQETYGLTSQMRRASSSICANLAEGCGRDGDGELARFCCIARGSASELEYHLLLSRDLHLIPASDHDKLALETTEVKRMLSALIQKLKAES